MRVADRFQALVPPRKRPFAALVGRARTDDRLHRREAVDVAATAHHQQAGHGRRFDVEHAPRVARGDGFPRGFVLPVDAVQIDPQAAALIEILQRVAQDAQARLPEQVHLQQAQFFHIVHRIVRRQQPLRALKQRHAVGDRVSADHQPARVHGEVARDAVEFAGHRQHGFVRLFVVRQMAAFGRLAHGLGGVAPHPRNVFGKTPRFALGNAVDLGDVGHGGAALKGMYRPDHGHVFPAVALENMLDHLVPAVPRQVQVDVGELGELHPLAVQKSLEGEAEAERANVADAERVAHQAAGRAAARERPDIARRAPLHQVGENQEILRIADLFDDAQLALQTLAHARLGVRTVTSRGAGFGLRPEHGRRILARKFREPDVAQFEVEVAALGHA